MAATARANFNLWASWSAYNIGLTTFDHSTFDGTDVFAVSPLDATFQGPYDDLSKLFDGYTVTRGRTSNLDEVAAGSCAIDIRDPSGIYNPDNASSPLFGTLEDRLHPIKLTATFENATTTRFYGWVRRFHWEPQGRRGVTQLECVDLFYWLDRFSPTIAATGATTTGAAIGKILDAVGLSDPAMRDLDTGDQIPGFSADGTLTGLQLIQGLLEAERGMFFAAATGKATYRSRASRLTKTSAYTFVDKMIGLSPGVDWDQAYTSATVIRSQSGHKAYYTNAALIAKGANNDLPEITTAYLSSDAQADALAQWMLAQNSQPKPPMRNFTIDSRETVLLEQQLARELVDRITVHSSRMGVVLYPDVVRSFTPALYWRLGDAVGAGVAADAAGNGNTGTVGSGVTLGQPGALVGDTDTAALFNNTLNAKVTANAYQPFVAGSKRTFMGWANRSTRTDSDTLLGGSAGVGNPALLIVQGSENVYWNPNGNVIIIGNWAAAWPGENQWVHWAFTYDDSTREAELFINGVSQGKKVFLAGYTGAGGTFEAGGYGGGAATEFWNGYQDEVAVFESILTPGTIQAIYAAGLQNQSDYNIDQITETLAGNNGRLTSQYLLSKAAKLNAAQFDSATDFSGAYAFVY